MSDRMARLFVGVLGFRATGMLRWIVAALVLALLAGVGIERWKAWELAGERQALEARAFELVTRAMAPGSALACLDAVASSTFEEGCEKALFATPESTAAAVSYVAAQLSLLAAGQGLPTARRRAIMAPRSPSCAGMPNGMRSASSPMCLRPATAARRTNAGRWRC